VVWILALRYPVLPFCHILIIWFIHNSFIPIQPRLEMVFSQKIVWSMIYLINLPQKSKDAYPVYFVYKSQCHKVVTIIPYYFVSIEPIDRAKTFTYSYYRFGRLL
jgi:hypothetical protein